MPPRKKPPKAFGIGFQNCSSIAEVLVTRASPMLSVVALGYQFL